MKLFLQTLLFCGVLRYVLGGGERYFLEPGLLTRFNHPGILLTHEVFLKFWTQELLDEPPITFTAPFYSLAMTATSVDFGKARLELIPPNSGTHISTGGSVSFFVSWQFFSGQRQYSGNNTMIIGGIDVLQQILFRRTEDGLGQALPGICSARIGDFSFEVPMTEPTTVLFIQIIENNLKSRAVGTICDGSAEAVPRLASRVLDIAPIPALPISIFFPDVSDINVLFTLTKPSVVNGRTVTNFHSGKVFSTIHNPSQRVPIERSVFPSMIPVGQMAQVVMGEFFFNTMNYALWQNGVFDEIQSGKSMSKRYNTDIRAIALANALPEFEPYENSSLEYNDTAMESPVVRINSSGIFTTEKRMTEISAIFRNETREKIATVIYNNDIKTQLWVYGNGIYRRAVKLVATVEGDTDLDKAFDQFKSRGNKFFLRFLNDQYAQRPWIRLNGSLYNQIDPVIRLLEGAVDIGFDLEFEDWQ